MQLVCLRPQLEFKNPSDTPYDPVRNRKVISHCVEVKKYVGTVISADLKM